MPKRETTWLKNPAAVAATVGLKLYDQKARWKQYAAQLADVRELIAGTLVGGVAPFPAKQKSGWPKAAVRAWLKAHVTLAADKRSFTVAARPGYAAQGELADPPAPPKPAPAPSPAADLYVSAEDIDRILAQFPPAYQQRYRGLYEKWKNPNSEEDKALTQREHQELIDIGLVKKPRLAAGAEADPAGDEFTGGLEAVAAYIQMKHPGVICNKMDISNWQRLKFLPAGCTEQFPPSHQSGRNSKKKIDAWVLKHLKPAGTEQNLPGVADNIDYDRAQKKLNFERAQAEFEVWRQSTSHKYLETAVAGAFIEAFGTYIGWQQDRVIEDEHGVLATVLRLVQEVCGAPAEQLAVLKARLRPELVAMNDSLKNTLREKGDETWQQLVRDRREQVQKLAKEI